MEDLHLKTQWHICLTTYPQFSAHPLFSNVQSASSHWIRWLRPALPPLWSTRWARSRRGRSMSCTAARSHTVAPLTPSYSSLACQTKLLVTFQTQSDFMRFTNLRKSFGFSFLKWLKSSTYQYACEQTSAEQLYWSIQCCLASSERTYFGMRSIRDGTSLRNYMK